MHYEVYNDLQKLFNTETDMINKNSCWLLLLLLLLLGAAALAGCWCYWLLVVAAVAGYSSG